MVAATSPIANYERGSGRRWAFMQWHNIPDLEFPNETYLARLRIVQTPWFGVFLHHIKLPDKDRALHNHPWTFATLILKGWYDESTPLSFVNPAGKRKEHRWDRWSVHGMTRDKYHAITNLSPDGAWTLVFVGPRKADWGYAVPRDNGGWRWIDHETYHKERLNG